MSQWVTLGAEPPTDEIERVTFVPFLPDGATAAIRVDGARWMLPAGVLRDGEHIRLGGALRILLETAGFRTQRLHAFARSGSHIAFWSEGDAYRGDRPHATVDLQVAEAGVLAAGFRVCGDDEAAQLVELAASSRATTDPRVLREEHVAMLERNYLASDTVEGGSGYGGTPGAWRVHREPIVDGVHHDGTLLDLGCANGLLMESVRAWARERGIDIEPYGVDISAGLVERARARLPKLVGSHLAGRFHQMAAPGGMRFDFVHASSHALVERAEVIRLLTFVRPGGLLLYSRYIASDAHDRTAAQSLRSLGFHVAGECRAAADGRGAPPTTAWIEVAP